MLLLATVPKLLLLMMMLMMMRLTRLMLVLQMLMTATTTAATRTMITLTPSPPPMTPAAKPFRRQRLFPWVPMQFLPPLPHCQSTLAGSAVGAPPGMSP
jgi:hypothetical protein